MNSLDDLYPAAANLLANASLEGEWASPCSAGRCYAQIAFSPDGRHQREAILGGHDPRPE